ncbi:type VII secretion protein EccB [Mycobacterium branderi]|uniref:ESX-4 secretion system ATPase EccB4 n=1 Tax=Mycobacterium branderi TaxID=43348 RepID=A0A7I7VYI0_9MYCO|nr:type VII secretion protein EccB [Mycobacterium branderi]MCV7233244.1 type VII secretion protein EccB [Mycobacterium branderi]ORA41314.1 type VII secretion protein EccB [Mycobacterium branderi]BBZ10359.1 ESX-4 secretion system ATPase EccB4 [Mycobacterium branderi]
MATTQLHLSGYRFLLRRIECALVGGDARPRPMRALAAGALVATLVIGACAVLGVLRPSGALGNAPIVMARQSGALYVRVGDTWHPVLNLASARLIAASGSNPQPVAESELAHTKRGPLMGIPGAPQLLPEPLDDTGWTVCDSDAGTTVVVGSAHASHRLAVAQTVLVTADSGASTYLLYEGVRATVDLTQPAVVRVLRLEGIVPHRVSHALLNAIPEAPPITAPRIPSAGGPGRLPGFPIGSVLRIARADGDEHYVVLAGGVQRVGPVAADLLRLNDARGARSIISVAPDVIRAAPTVADLPVSTFPERASAPLDVEHTPLCATWTPTADDAVMSIAAGAPPIPAGQLPVALSQGDGAGPAVDAVYVPPGRSAYVRATGLSGENPEAGTRFLVTETGVRFGIADDDAARALGLPQTAIPAPWPVLATLPAGPELSRANALVVRDSLGAP